MDEMCECFPNPKFTLRVTKKLQGASYKGVMVTLSSSEVNASMNLYSYYERADTGVSEHQVMDMIKNAVREASKNISQIDWNVLGDYERTRGTLMLQMVPVKGNEEKLAKIPHETVEDITVVYHFDLGSSGRETSSALVTDAMRKNYGIIGEQLAANVIGATVKDHPASLWKKRKPKSRKPLFMRKTLQRAFSFPSTIYRRENR